VTTLYVSHPTGLDQHTDGVAERPERSIAIKQVLAGRSRHVTRVMLLATEAVVTVIQEDVMSAQPSHRCKLSVFADYFQFYAWDPEISAREAPTDWTEGDIQARAKMADGVVVLCPVRNMQVPVEVGLWQQPPEIQLAAWQHIVEAPLRTNGTLEIHECTGGSLSAFSVEPGDYTVRALYRGLDTLSDDGLDGRDEYELQIWKAKCPTLRVLRQWD
jgi:hypothetical protein